MPISPSVSANDQLLQFLFSKAPRGDDLRKKADAREALDAVQAGRRQADLTSMRDYELSARSTQNVVGIVEGSDPNLKSTYVAAGAHYDHASTPTTNCRRAEASWRTGRVTPVLKPTASGTAQTMTGRGRWR